MKFDRYDLALLNLLQTESARTLDALAGSVGLSPSAVQRRVSRLRKSGAIERETAVLSNRIWRRRVSAQINIQMASHAWNAVEQLKAVLLTRREIFQCFEVSGTYDLICGVAVHDLNALNEFTDAVIRPHPQVARFETTIIKTWLRTTGPLVLDERDLAALV